MPTALNPIRFVGKPMKKYADQSGFTLIELLTTLCIAAVLITLSAPSFIHFIQQIRLTNACNALVSSMNLARAEAIKRNARVDLIAQNGSWKNGWMIAADQQQIFVHEALHSDIKVDSTFPNKTKPSIAYNGTGRTRADSSSYAPHSGTLRLSLGDNSRLIVVNFLGRIRVCNPTTAPANTCVSAALNE